MLGGNIIKRSNFETGVLADITAAGFTPINATLTLDSTAGMFVGTRSLKIATSATFSGITYKSPDVVISSGEIWTVSFMIIGAAGTVIRFRDGNAGVDGSFGAGMALETNFTLTGELQYKSFTWTYTNYGSSQGLFPSFYIDAPAVATFWIDNIQMEKGSKATSYFLHESERLPGDLITKDYQYEFNGFLFGSGTDTIVEKLTGLLGLSETNAEDSPLQGEHGVAPSQQVMDRRVLEFDLHLLGAPVVDIEERLDWMRSKFQPQRLDQWRMLSPLVFKRPGKSKQQLFVRCEKRDFASTYDVARGRAAGSIRLVAPDPVIYSIALKQRSLTIASGAVYGRLTYIFNAGDHRDGYKPVIEITGPCRNPVLQHIQSGLTMTFTGLDVQAGETLIIDFVKRTALVGASNKVGLLNAASQWFRIRPGTNTIDYTRSSAALTGASSTMTVKWRDTSA